MPEMLTKAHVNFKCHSSIFRREEDDDVWIRKVAKEGMLIVSSDKGLETDPNNRLAVIESKARVYILDDKSRGALWAAALIVGKERIYEIAQDHPGPYYVNVMRKSNLCWKLREPSLEEAKSEAPTTIPEPPQQDYTTERQV